LKTKSKCVAAVKEALKEGKSVVVDNTHPSIGARSEFVKLAGTVPVRCFYFSIPSDLSQHLNKFREAIGDRHKRVPTIAFNMYKKNFALPTSAEGFAEVIEIPFLPDLASMNAEHRKLLTQWSC